MCVANEDISWHLGVGNRQLIVLGFLLGIMNLCLSTVSPFFMLLLEARFGRSTLQNYSGLLQMQMFAPQLTFHWRVAHFTLLALPICLSVAYKGFNGGSSGKHFNAAALIGAQPCYGLFVPPGLQEVDSVGLMFFANATLPFNIATSPTAQDQAEPPLPKGNQAYGHNTLMVNENVTAFLDIPEPSYLSTIQSRLAIGESWNASASVLGTVASFDESMLPDKNLTFFTSICNSSVHGTDWVALVMYNRRLLHFLVPFGSGPDTQDNSLIYVGFTVHNISIDPYDCNVLAETAQAFRITRQVCKGTWTVTRGGFQLESGSCSGVPAEPQLELQHVITDNYLAPANWYMGSLSGLLLPFNDDSGSRNSSRWIRPYMAVSTAGVIWSRLVSLVGAARMFNSSESLQQHANTKFPWFDFTWQKLGILYPNEDMVTYVRPTLEKFAWLYLILSIQTLLTVFMLVVSILLYSTPISQNFGLISILSGLSRPSVPVIAGAGLSGKLGQEIQLNIRPVTAQENAVQMLDYQLLAPSKDFKNTARLSRNSLYG